MHPRSRRSADTAVNCRRTIVGVSDQSTSEATTSASRLSNVIRAEIGSEPNVPASSGGIGPYSRRPSSASMEAWLSCEAVRAGFEHARAARRLGDFLNWRPRRGLPATATGLVSRHARAVSALTLADGLCWSSCHPSPWRHATVLFSGINRSASGPQHARRQPTPTGSVRWHRRIRGGVGKNGLTYAPCFGSSASTSTTTKIAWVGAAARAAPSRGVLGQVGGQGIEVVAAGGHHALQLGRPAAARPVLAERCSYALPLRRVRYRWQRARLSRLGAARRCRQLTSVHCPDLTGAHGGWLG